MDEVPSFERRSRPRTAVLILISIVVPILGVILGSIEIGFRSYLFGAFLIFLAVLSSFVLSLLIMHGGV